MLYQLQSIIIFMWFQFKWILKCRPTKKIIFYLKLVILQQVQSRQELKHPKHSFSDVLFIYSISLFMYRYQFCCWYLTTCLCRQRGLTRLLRLLEGVSVICEVSQFLRSNFSFVFKINVDFVKTHLKTPTFPSTSVFFLNKFKTQKEELLSVSIS